MFKITNLLERHQSYQYNDGLNTLNTMDLEPPLELKYLTEGKCTKGLYYSDQKNIHNFAEHGCWIGPVTIPPDAKSEKDLSHDTVKWRTDKMILGKRLPLFSAKTIETLGLSTDLSFFNKGLIFACTTGQMNIAEFCITSGANNFNIGLYYACTNGHNELVDLCIYHGAYECFRVKCGNTHDFKESVELQSRLTCCVSAQVD
jgi:hypothetical protein